MYSTTTVRDNAAAPGYNFSRPTIPPQLAVPVHQIDRAGTNRDRCVAVAVTVFPGHWCIGFLVPELGRERTDWYEGEPEEVRKALHGFASEGYSLVGYDREGHDTHLLAGLLTGRDLYQLSLELAAATQPYRKRPAPLPCEYIDLAGRLSGGGTTPTLLSVAANLGHPILAEAPFPPGTVVSEEQWPQIREYNQVQLWHTWALLEHLLPEIQAVETLAPEVGRDLRSLPKARVVDQLFMSHFRQRTGALPLRPQSPREVNYRPVAGVRRPRTPEAAAWFDLVTSQPISVVNGRGQVPQRQFRIGPTAIRVGGGGLHTKDHAELYISTHKHRIISVDVTSYYPTIIATKGITPQAYGQQGREIFQEILERRLATKKAIKAATGQDREWLQRQSDVLKLVLNSSFGKLGSPYSSLYDPQAMFSVTISGQLMLLDLIERLDAAGVRILSCNTDGLFLKVGRRDRSWRRILKEWQADTGMSLEIEPVHRLAIVATNNYAVKMRDGRHKRRGTSLRGSLDPEHVPNHLVINDAIAAALLEDCPPEVTIRQCTDGVRFAGLLRSPSATDRPVLRDASGDTPLPTITRWCHNSEIQNKVVRDHGSSGAAIENIVLTNDLSERWPGDVAEVMDRDGWYPRRARRELQKVKLPQFLTKKLARSNHLAAAVHKLGLTPAPKWAGKNVLAGTDARQPTPLWEWAGIETAGVYTGWKTATLVVDVDENAVFAAWAFRAGIAADG